MATIKFYLNGAEPSVMTIKDSCASRPGELIAIPNPPGVKKSTYKVDCVDWTIDHANIMTRPILRAGVKLSTIE